MAALRQRANTARLAPLVKSAVVTLANWLQEMDCPQLLRRSGHYEIWFHPNAREQAHARLCVLPEFDCSVAHHTVERRAHHGMVELTLRLIPRRLGLEIFGRLLRKRISASFTPIRTSQV